jgi:putative ATP-binding cassette transporter
MNGPARHMTTGTGSGQDVALGRETAVRLGRSIRGFVTSEVGGRAAALALLLLALLLAINGLNVVNSYVGRDFMTAIERRDGPGFVRMALVYVGVFATSTVVAVVYRFSEERLGLLWREWLTRRVVELYLGGRLYYRLNVAGTLTNPDQRIADDVRSLTSSTLSLALVFLNGTLTIVAFSGVLWSISRLLFAVAVGYAALGSLLAVVLGRPLVRLNFQQSDREADFRAELIHVRQNTESIAMLDREAHLRARLLRRVDALVANMKRIVAVNRNLGFFTTGYNYLIQLIPAFIVAPLFIRGTAEFGEISQSSMAFAHLIGAFSLVVTQFPSLSSYAAVLARLSPLAGAAGEVPESGTSPVVVEERPERLAFERLTLRSPHDGRVLVRELSLEVPPRARLLVATPDDLATTALERVVAGIWESGEGRVVRPPPGGVRLLPERPYLPPGTLRELLVGPDAVPGAPDDRIREALRTVGVDAAVERVGGLDVERDWDDLLTLEEQRLVELVRLDLDAPRFAVLVRLDAGLGVARATAALAALAGRGVAYLVLGDGALGRAPFDTVVEIAGDGTWSVVAAKDGAA